MNSQLTRLRMQDVFSKLFASFIIRNICILVVLALALASFTAASKNQLNQYEINNNGHEFAITTIATTTSDVLEEAKISLSDSDKVFKFENQIDIVTFKNIKLNLYSNKFNKIVRSKTVKELIGELDIKIGANDRINYSLDQEIFDNQEIKIDFVQYETITQSKSISYAEFKKAYKNEKVSLDPNKEVIVTTTKKIQFVNGETKSKKLVNRTFKSGKEVYSKKYSSNGVMSTLSPTIDIKLNASGIPVNYTKKLTGTASAYCTGTTTSTGKRVQQGYIAVNPKQIPYGTRMYIRTPDGKWLYGYAVAADTGGFVSWGNTIADLYMNSYSDCVSFGRRQIEIYILD